MLSLIFYNVSSSIKQLIEFSLPKTFQKKKNHLVSSICEFNCPEWQKHDVNRNYLWEPETFLILINQFHWKMIKNAGKKVGEVLVDGKTYKKTFDVCVECHWSNRCNTIWQYIHPTDLDSLYITRVLWTILHTPPHKEMERERTLIQCTKNCRYKASSFN